MTEAFEVWFRDEYGIDPSDEKAFCSGSQFQAWRAAIMWMASRQEPVAQYMGTVGDHYTIHLDKWDLPVDAPLYAAPVPRAPEGWQPIATASQRPFDFVFLAWGLDEDKCTGKGCFRDGGWVANATFHKLGRPRDDAWEFRELAVHPTHWMPLPAAPLEAKP